MAENKLASYEGQGRDIERQIQTINARAEEAKACVDSAKRELEKKENAVEKFDVCSISSWGYSISDRI